MTHDSEQLEILISRELDGENSDDEAGRLRAVLRADAAARSLFDRYRRIDRYAGEAMRSALGRTARPTSIRWRGFRLSQFAGLAAAACLAMLVWLSPPEASRTLQGTVAPQARSSSWFADSAPAADELAPDSAYDRPAVRVKNTQRDYIMIPAGRPGEYLLISMDRVRTRLARIQRDF